jgi:hypothetical protein
MVTFNAPNIAEEYIRRWGREYRIEDHLSISKFMFLMEEHKDKEVVAEVVAMLTNMVLDKKHRAWGPLYGKTTAVEQLPPFIGDMNDPAQVQDLLDKVVAFCKPYKKPFAVEDIADEILYGDKPISERENTLVHALARLTEDQSRRINCLSAEYREGLCYGAVGFFQFDHKAPLKRRFVRSTSPAMLSLAQVEKVSISDKPTDEQNTNAKIVLQFFMEHSESVESMIDNTHDYTVLTGSALVEQICNAISHARGRGPLPISPVNGWMLDQHTIIEHSMVTILAGGDGSQQMTSLCSMYKGPSVSSICGLEFELLEYDGSSSDIATQLRMDHVIASYQTKSITTKAADTAMAAKLMCLPAPDLNASKSDR